MRTIIMLITESVIALTVFPIYAQTITADKLEIFMKTKTPPERQ